MSFGGFGSSAFGTNTNNNNNNRPAGGLFGGGGGAFGTTTNTGSTGFGSSGNTGFGNNNNNASGGGLFGGNANNTASSGFGTGGFGSSNNNTASNTGSLFGGNNTSSGGGGMFGNTANSGSTGFGTGGTGFGSNNNTSTGFGSNAGGSLFGNKTQPASTGFGNSNTGGGMFGNANTSAPFGGSSTSGGTGFGGGTTGFGSGATGQNPGTGGTPFQPVIENEGVGSSSKAHYQSIAFQEPYKNWSFQELRQQDYDQGRKFGNQNGQAGAFGAAPTFGGATNTTSNNAFGATGSSTGFGGGGFGTNQNNNSGFGNSNNNAFGTNTGGGLFGNNTSKPATPSLFGNATTSASTGGGLFGTSNNTTGGGFGNSNTGGAFGTANNNTSFGGNSGGFGNNTSNTGGGLFGNQPATSQPSTFGGGGLFGQQNQQSNQSAPFGGGFNTNNNNATQPKSLFGNATNNTNTGSSLFGNTQQTNQQANSSPFGNNNQQNNTGGLFGAAKPATGTGLFGNTSSNTGNQSGGLFGNNNDQASQPASTSLFGAAKPSLFGNTTASNTNTGGGGLFGNTQNNNTQQNNGGSLFGNTTQPQQNVGNSLFGNSQQQPFLQSQQPQQLTASIASANPYGHEQLFANLGTPQQAVGPLATPLSSSQKARRPVPIPAYKLNPAASTRLITPQKRSGYGFSYSTYGTPGSAYGSPSPYSGSLLSGGYGSRSLNKSLSVGNLRSSHNAEDSILNPNAFSPSQRSGRASGSMKRLQINRNLRTDLFGTNDSLDGARASPLKKAVSFDDEASNHQQSGGESSSALVRIDEDRDSATPTAEEMGFLRSSTSRSHTNGRSPAREMEQSTGKELATVPEDGSPDRPVPSREQQTIMAKALRDHEDMPLGAYWMSPKQNQLKKMSRQALAAMKNFTVGRIGAGQITFYKVDLSVVEIDAILGTIVVLGTRQATVYPDHDNKPKAGKGLNVPATVTMSNSWPRHQAGRVKIFDKKGPKFEKHVDRMRRLAGTEFVNYNADNGDWTFKVQHFSTYELNYDDGDSFEMLSPLPESFDQDQSPLSSKGRSNGPDEIEDVSMLTDGSGPGAEDTFHFKRSRGMPGLFDEDALETPDMMETVDDHSRGQCDFYPSQSQGSEMDSTNHAVPLGETNGFDASSEIGSFNGGFDGQMDMGSPRHSPTQAQSLKPKSILKASQQPRSIFGTPSKGKHLLDEDVWAEQLQRTLSPKKQDRQALRESQGFALRSQKTQDRPIERPLDKRPFATSMDIMDSLFGKSLSGNGAMKQPASDKGFKWPYPKRHKKQADLDAMPDTDQRFHNSSKARWSINSILTTGSLSRSKTPSRRPSRSSASNDVRASPVFPLLPSSQSFDKFRQLTTVKLEDGVPRARMDGNFSFADFASRAEETDLAGQNEEIMWQLAQILFDSQDPESDEQSKRKQILIQFWKSITTSAALEHATKAKTAEEKALAHLSAFDVWSATEALLQGGNPRLATMIAQIGGDDTMRKAVTDQINHWRDENDLSEISPRIRALYELLAGNTCVSEGKSRAGPENKAENLNISSRFGLNWRRAFGLKLWYGIPEAEPVDQIIESFGEDLSSYREKVKPVPWFRDAKASTGWDDPSPSDRQDILWGLLKIYDHSQQDSCTKIDIASILAPENISGNPLNARLSFQLYHVLFARDIVPMSEDSTFPDALTSTLAAQLSTSPHTLVSAIFVLLHLSTPTARADAIRDLLTRHAAAFGSSPDTCPTFRTLTTDFHIPASWIYLAKATFERAVTHDRAAQSLCLLRAGEIKEAHDVLVRVVAPSCVIEERLIGNVASDLRVVLGHLKESEAVHLSEWRTGGSLYADFVELAERTQLGMTNGSSDGDRNAINILPGSQQDLKRLCKRIRGLLPGTEAWQRAGLEERVAYEEMRVVVDKLEEALERLKGGGDDAGAYMGQKKNGKGTARHGDVELKAARAASDAYYGRLADAAAA